MEEEMMQQQVLQEAAQAGRGGDSVLAHLSLGEVIIPRDIMADPEAGQAIMAIFEAFGVNPGEFTVGDPANKINPETGNPEFFFKSKFFRRVAPIALSLLAPGIGTALGITSAAGLTALGAGLGGLGGLASGGGLKGALAGAALGGLSSGLSSNFASAGSMGGNIAANAGTAAGRGVNTLSGLARSTGSVFGGGSSVGGGTGLKGILSAKNLGSLYAGMEEDDAAKKALRAQVGAIAPYNQMGLDAQRQLSANLAAGFNPEDLTKDPGYQFRLRQGQDALNASLAAQGMGQSGAALKAAQDYSQNFAANEYSNAYDRWLAQNNQLSGLGQQGFAGAAGVGDVTGQYQQQRGIAKQRRIAELLAGLGIG